MIIRELNLLLEQEDTRKKSKVAGKIGSIPIVTINPDSFNRLYRIKNTPKHMLGSGIQAAAFDLPKKPGHIIKYTALSSLKDKTIDTVTIMMHNQDNEFFPKISACKIYKTKDDGSFHFFMVTQMEKLEHVVPETVKTNAKFSSAMIKQFQITKEGKDFFFPRKDVDNKRKNLADVVKELKMLPRDEYTRYDREDLEQEIKQIKDSITSGESPVDGDIAYKIFGNMGKFFKHKDFMRFTDNKALIDAINVFNHEMDFDLHHENWMFRKNGQIVFTDPLHG